MNLISKVASYYGFRSTKQKEEDVIALQRRFLFEWCPEWGYT